MDQCPGDGDSLPLPPGESASALSYSTEHTLRHGGNKVPSSRRTQGLLHVLFGEIAITEGDVDENRIVKKKDLLGDVANHPTPFLYVDLGQGEIVNPYLAFLRAQEADNEIDHRCFSDPRWSHDSGERASGEGKGGVP